MTSPLPLQSIQQDCETHHSDSVECTAVCLTSSFDVNGFWGREESALGGSVFRERLPDRDSVHLVPRTAQIDFYTAQIPERSKLNNTGKKEVGQVALAAEAFEGSSSPAARLAV